MIWDAKSRRGSGGCGGSGNRSHESARDEPLGEVRTAASIGLFGSKSANVKDTVAYDLKHSPPAAKSDLRLSTDSVKFPCVQSLNEITFRL